MNKCEQSKNIIIKHQLDIINGFKRRLEMEQGE